MQCGCDAMRETDGRTEGRKVGRAWNGMADAMSERGG
jgi:hypothetical protein